MIICINGKSVGNMTLPELQIELEVCGPELVLVLSRFDINNESTTLEDLAMDWNDIGAGCASPKRKTVSFEESHDAEEKDLHVQNREKEELELVHGSNSACATLQTKELPPSDNRDEKKNTPAKSLSPKHPLSLCKSTKPRPNPSWSLSKCQQQRKSHTVVNYSSHPNNSNSPKGGSCASTSESSKSEKKQSSKKRGRISTVEKERPIARIDQTKDTRLNASESTKTSGRDRSTVAPTRYQEQLDELSDEDHTIVPNSVPRKNKETTVALKDHTMEASSAEDECGYDDDDDDPWLGCVCGKTHPPPIKVFWIQCEGCNAWHNVAQECVGFDASAAEELDEWCCWACAPPVDGLGL
jgi:hypothetical protein